MKYFILLLLLGMGFLGFGQDKKPTRYLELGLGANSYKGDLSHQYRNWSGSGNISIVNNFGKKLCGTFNFQLGTLTAQNADYFFDDNTDPQPTPNKFAKTSFLSLHYGLRLTFFRRQGFSAFISQGIGLFRFQPKDQNNEKLLSKLDTRKENETYSNLAFYFPTNIGMVYVLKQGYGVGFQVGWYNTSTDYLDNISQWGNRTKNDNVLCYKLSFVTPLSFKSKVKAAPVSTDPSNTSK